MTTLSDADSPKIYKEKLDNDKLLIKWYGTNPSIDPHPKFEPFPLGLSQNHPQDKYLRPYLALKNFSNPFTNRSRWTSRLQDLSVDDIFVMFGINKHSKRRAIVKNAICELQTAQDGLSCGNKRANPTEIYAAASKVSAICFVTCFLSTIVLRNLLHFFP